MPIIAGLRYLLEYYMLVLFVTLNFLFQFETERTSPDLNLDLYILFIVDLVSCIIINCIAGRGRLAQC